MGNTPTPQADWFSSNAPKSAAGDWFDSNAPKEPEQTWGERHPLAREAALGVLSAASGLPEDIRAYENPPAPSVGKSVEEGIKSGFPIVRALEGAARTGRGLYEAGKSLIPSNVMADPEAAAHGVGTIAGNAALAAVPESEAVGEAAMGGARGAVRLAGKSLKAVAPIVGDKATGTVGGLVAGHMTGIPYAAWPAAIVGRRLAPSIGRFVGGMGDRLASLGAEPRVAPMPNRTVTLPGGVILEQDAEGNWTSPNAPRPRAVGVPGRSPERPAVSPEANPNVATTFGRPRLSLPPAGDIQVAGIPEQRALPPAPFLVTPETRGRLALPPAPEAPLEAPVVRGEPPLSTARVPVTPPEALERNPALVVGRGAENHPMSNTARTRDLVAGRQPKEPSASARPAAAEEKDYTEPLKEMLRQVRKAKRAKK